MVTFLKVLLIALLTTIIVGWAGAPVMGASDVFVGGINQVRAAQSLTPMTVDQELTNLATEWSKTMAANGAISHSDLVTGITANWSRLGENVGVGGSAESVQAALVASPAHLANMLGEFTYVGVGTYEASGKLWVTEKFMAVFPAVVPTPRTTVPPPPPPTLPKPIITAPATVPPPPPTTVPPPPVTTIVVPPIFIAATIPDKALGPLLRRTTTTTRLTVFQWLITLFARWRLTTASSLS